MSATRCKGASPALEIIRKGRDDSRHSIVDFEMKASGTAFIQKNLGTTSPAPGSLVSFTRLPSLRQGKRVWGGGNKTPSAVHAAPRKAYRYAIILCVFIFFFVKRFELTFNGGIKRSIDQPSYYHR